MSAAVATLVTEEPINYMSEFTQLDALFSEYAQMKNKIISFGEVAANEDCLGYFFEAYQLSHSNTYLRLSASTVFDVESAIKALDSTYWQKVINMTDILEAMPSKQRTEWHENYTNQTFPPFEREYVINTMKEQLVLRETYFAERVRLVWDALSPDHVTNKVEAFNTTLIFNLYNGGYPVESKIEAIHDLRVIIGRFFERDVSRSAQTRTQLIRMYDFGKYFGKWNSMDGNTWQIKIHKKGTAHIRINPSVSYKLNRELAKIFPQAIPSRFRKKPKTPPKSFELKDDLLSVDVLEQLSRLDYRHNGDVSLSGSDKDMSNEMQDILKYLGGSQLYSHTPNYWKMTYDPMPAIEEILRTGAMPEQKSHQFYATNETLAKEAIRISGVSINDETLEPSSGVGHIARYLPSKEKTTCIDIDGRHVRALERQGYKRVLHHDFLQFEYTDFDNMFDKIILNPPYSNNQWYLHTEHATRFVKDGGSITAILPASAVDKLEFEGFSVSYSEVKKDMFKDVGASVRVVIAHLVKN